MSDPALTELESLRKAIEANTKQNRELVEEMQGFREDLHGFTEQVKVIVSAVQGMGGAGAVLGMIQRLLPMFGAPPPTPPRGR